MTNEEIEKLLETAKQATQGDWRAETEHPTDCVVWGPHHYAPGYEGHLVCNVGKDCLRTPGDRSSIAFDMAPRDAKFIAEARPSVITPLLEELVALRKEKESQKDSFNLTLNKYQRDNLLMLLTACGCQRGKGVYPFTLIHNGDWLKEIGSMLGELNPEDRPNQTVEQLNAILAFYNITNG
jgi:hypothetical protein